MKNKIIIAILTGIITAGPLMAKGSFEAPLPGTGQTTCCSGECSLAQKAMFTPNQARTIANNRRPGSYAQVVLEKRNGALVYEVLIEGYYMKAYKIRVDAGTGRILGEESGISVAIPRAAALGRY